MLGWTDAPGQEGQEVDGQFNIPELFRALSMNNGKGLPQQAEVEAVLGWLAGEGQAMKRSKAYGQALRISRDSRYKKLKHYEQSCGIYFCQYGYRAESDMRTNDPAGASR